MENSTDDNIENDALPNSVIVIGGGSGPKEGARRLLEGILFLRNPRSMKVLDGSSVLDLRQVDDHSHRSGKTHFTSFVRWTKTVYFIDADLRLPCLLDGLREALSLPLESPRTWIEQGRITCSWDGAFEQRENRSPTAPNRRTPNLKPP